MFSDKYVMSFSFFNVPSGIIIPPETFSIGPLNSIIF